MATAVSVGTDNAVVAVAEADAMADVVTVVTVVSEVIVANEPSVPKEDLVKVVKANRGAKDVVKVVVMAARADLVASAAMAKHGRLQTARQ